MQRSFGPAAIQGDDGSLRISCVTRRTYCFLCVGSMCTDQKPPRQIKDTSNTPDWCQYAQSIRNDVAEIQDFKRMGLADMTRPELMKLMKDVPVEYRASVRGKPFSLPEHNAEMMRAAIRKFRLAEGSGADG